MRRSHSVPEEKLEQPRFCARCGQPIVVADARFCKACGAPIARLRLLRRDPGYTPMLALALSIVPGLGQIYRGKLFRGIMWFFGVSMAYASGPILGVLIHLICASNAAFAGAIREDVLIRPSAE